MKKARNKQPKKAQSETTTVSQGQVQEKTYQAKQGKKASEKARKDKKQKSHRSKQDLDQREGSTPASGTNTTPTKKKAGQNQGQTRNQNQDVSEVTCYNYNKKDHYSSNSPKPKN